MFLAECRTAVCRHDGSTGGQQQSGKETYRKLHFALAATWARRSPFLYAGKSEVLAFVAIYVIVIIITVASGNCIPLYTITHILFFTLRLVIDLASLASGNAEIDDITRLYRDTQIELKEMLASLESDPASKQDSAIANRLRDHDLLISGYLQVDHLRAKFFGRVVDYSAIQSALATFASVAVALWSILRASGGSITVQTGCFS